MERQATGGRRVSPPTDTGKSKYRAKQSCIPCRTRKVKCDRIKPCQACCIRGLPSECEYVATNEDRYLISQADAIEGLRNEVGRLKQRLAELNISDPPTGVDNKEKAGGTGRPNSQSSSESSSVPTSPADAMVLQKYNALETIMKVIASAPPDVVTNTIAQVRSGASLEKVAESSGKFSKTTEDLGLDIWGNRIGPAPPPQQPQPPPPPPPPPPPSQPITQNTDSNSSVDVPDDEPRAKRLKTGTRNDHTAPKQENQSNGNSSSSPTSTPPTANRLTLLEDTENDDSLTDDDSFLDELHAEVTALLVSSNSSKRDDIDSISQPLSQKHIVMEVFLEKFIDVFSPNVDLSCGPSRTLRSAAGIRMFSPILSDAFRAVSITHFGQSVKDRRMEQVAYRAYMRVLRNLQQALYDPEQSKSQGILLTVAVLMSFETLQRTTGASIVDHVLGAMRLLEHRGPHRHMFGIEHNCFTELRPYWTSIALVTRSPSFLAREEWKVVPWSTGSSVKDIMHHLLDRVVDIPAFLSQFDRFMESVSTGVMPYAEIAPTQRMLWNWVSNLEKRLRQWKKDWVDSYAGGQAKEVITQGPDAFPVFKCRNLASMEILRPTTLVYPDLRLAQTMCIYYAAQLVLAASDTRPTGAVSPQEQYTFACNICRSMEFYIRTAPGSLINRLAFPLRTAYDALPDGNVERKYVEEVFKLVEERFKLRLWGSTIPEISTKRPTTT